MIETEQNRGINAKLERLLRPRSIALVGASATPGALGESVLINLEEAAYGGDLYLINPKRPMVHGRQCLGAIEELPSGIDCAVLAIPGTAVLASLRACAAKGIRSAIVFSAGFAEAGEGGRAAQQEAARIAEEHDMILLGPNCLGMVNYVDGIPLTFVVTPPQASTNTPGAAILSQSGALAAVISVNMRRHAIPLTYSVSTGNEASSGVEDYIEHLIGDKKTRVLALVVEQFRQPMRLLELARRARAAGQFIVLLHPGRGNAARASAATHTGAIAGDYQIMRTLVNAAGVILVESLEELVDVAQVLVRCRDLPRGGAAIFTESGAFKALALDLCERIGLALPSLSAQSEEELRKALPAFIPPSNPLDLTAQGLVDPGLYRRTLPAVLQDDAFGSVLLTIILTDSKTTRLKLPPILEAIETLQPRKPILFAAVDEGAPFDFSALDRLRELGVACFPSPERAMRALAHVTRCASNPESHDHAPQSERQINALKPGLLTEWESKQILARIGIAVSQGGMARTRAEAILLAASIGYPVVLKAQSPLLPHKSDVGGVALGIQNESELREKWAELHADVHRARPGLELDGVLVERMSDAGLELIVGARNDPQWGPVLLAGFGGVLAEAINDVCLLPPGVSRAQIVKELLSLRGSALLRGFRGAPARDLAAVADVIQALDSLMRSCPEIAEIDINPLAVYQEGKGATALDALISIRGNNPEER